MTGGKFRFSARSISNLDVHGDLKRVALRALELSPVDFIVVDGGRTIAEQRHYVLTGKSKTMKSRHLGGFALDFVAWVDGKISYKHEHMKAVADAFKSAGKQLLGEGRIEWGGDWRKFVDKPHIQLSDRWYPDV
jgi:peptidoglycan L-alanyl-D-glutamate endopeptidase CwlK